MEGERQVYRVKVDASGRIVLPAEARQRLHIGEGDTVIMVDDALGLHIKTRRRCVGRCEGYREDR
jgi:AbrB family looped-hinge helix DNA binding protein